MNRSLDASLARASVLAWNDEERDHAREVARGGEARAISILIELEKAHRRKLPVQLSTLCGFMEVPAGLAPGRPNVHEGHPSFTKCSELKVPHQRCDFAFTSRLEANVWPLNRDQRRFT